MNIALSVIGDELWKKIGESLDQVELRRRKSVSIPETSGIRFAIVVGNAVRIGVAQVDPGAVRATNDVDVLIRPADLETVKRVMAEHGYHYRKADGLDMFLDGENDSVRYAIRDVRANQFVNQEDFEFNADVELSASGDGIRTLLLERLVRTKLNSFRLKDRVHILDMIGVGPLDESWMAKFPKTLAERLKSLIENPDH